MKKAPAEAAAFEPARSDAVILAFTAGWMRLWRQYALVNTACDAS